MRYLDLKAKWTGGFLIQSLLKICLVTGVFLTCAAQSCQIVCWESKGVSKGFTLNLCDPEPGVLFSLYVDYANERGYSQAINLIAELRCAIDPKDRRLMRCEGKNGEKFHTELVPELERIRFTITSDEVKTIPKALREKNEKTLIIDFNDKDCV